MGDVTPACRRTWPRNTSSSCAPQRRSLSPPANLPGAEGGGCGPSQRPVQRTWAARLWPGSASVAATSVTGNSIVPPPRLRVRRHGSSAATAYAEARFTNLKQEAEGRTPDSERSEEETTDATSPGRVFAITPIALRLWYCRRGKGRYCPSGNICWTIPAAVAGIENGDERLL
jgi:hypothetical protein